MKKNWKKNFFLNQEEDERKPAISPTVNQDKTEDTTVPAPDDTRNNDRRNTNAPSENGTQVATSINEREN